jgi:hypothetical protein
MTGRPITSTIPEKHMHNERYHGRRSSFTSSENCLKENFCFFIIYSWPTSQNISFKKTNIEGYPENVRWNKLWSIKCAFSWQNAINKYNTFACNAYLWCVIRLAKSLVNTPTNSCHSMKCFHNLLSLCNIFKSWQYVSHID